MYQCIDREMCVYIIYFLQNMWLSLTLEDAKLHLLFQSMSNTPYDFITGVGVNDGMLHSVTVIRSGLRYCNNPLAHIVNRNIFSNKTFRTSIFQRFHNT